MAIHAEIEYDHGSIHSDICPADCGTTITAEHRAFLHDVLDEYLSNGAPAGPYQP